MGRKGPLPRPDSSETARGRNTFHRKTKKAGFVEKYSDVKVPAEVQGDKLALKLWREHLPHLVTGRRITKEMAPAFGLLCRMLAEEARHLQTLDEEGWTYSTPKGPMAHPLVGILGRTRSHIVALVKEFGMTTAAESRIPHEVDDAEENTNPLTKFGIAS